MNTLSVVRVITDKTPGRLKNCFRLSTVSWSGLDWAQQPTGAPIPNAI